MKMGLLALISMLTTLCGWGILAFSRKQENKPNAYISRDLSKSAQTDHQP